MDKNKKVNTQQKNTKQEEEIYKIRKKEKLK